MFVYELIMVMSSNPVAVTSTSDIAPILSKEFLDIQATTEYRFTLKRVRDVIMTYRHVATVIVIYCFSKSNYLMGILGAIFIMHGVKK